MVRAKGCNKVMVVRTMQIGGSHQPDRWWKQPERWWKQPAGWFPGSNMSLSVSGCCSAQRFECLILWRKGQRWARCSVPQLQCWRDFLLAATLKNCSNQTSFQICFLDDQDQKGYPQKKRKKHSNSWKNCKVGRIRGDWYVQMGWVLGPL